jgi:colicin import membrane protein
MKMSQGIGHEPSLQRLVIASVVLHFILMALFLIPFRTGDKEFKTYYVSLVEPAKVIGVGEPAVRKSEEKPDVKKETPAKEKKTVDDKAITDKINQMAQDVKQQQTIDDKINNIKNKRDALNKVLTAKAEKDRARVIEASTKGAGGAPGKGAPMASDSDCPYCALIIEKIRDEWEIPPDFDSSGLEVEVSIKIDRTGKVIYKAIEKSSGNILFDQSALKAISKASPLDMPPLLLVMEEIVLRFYP